MRATASQDTVAAVKDLYDTAGIAALAEMISERLDRLAGPFALTEAEKIVQQACRVRFGEYRPTSAAQHAYIADLRRLAELELAAV